MADEHHSCFRANSFATYAALSRIKKTSKSFTEVETGTKLSHRMTYC